MYSKVAFKKTLLGFRKLITSKIGFISYSSEKKNLGMFDITLKFKSSMIKKRLDREFFY